MDGLVAGLAFKYCDELLGRVQHLRGEQLAVCGIDRIMCDNRDCQNLTGSSRSNEVCSPCLQHEVPEFDAAFTSGGLLTVTGCPADGASYRPLPPTTQWGAESKAVPSMKWVAWAAYKAVQSDFKVKHRKVNDIAIDVRAAHTVRPPHRSTLLRAATQDHRYTQPVLLEGIEAVLVRCGQAYRLLVRLAAANDTPSVADKADIGHGNARSKVSNLTQMEQPTTVATDKTYGNQAESQDERLNVVVLFIDSLSRRHFFRRLPHTAQVLETLAAGMSVHAGSGCLTAAWSAYVLLFAGCRAAGL